MRRLWGAALAAAMLPGIALASEAGDRLPELLYSGTASDHRALFDEQCAMYHMDACFGLGLIDFIGAYEGLSRALYRHGATTPDIPVAAMLLGLDTAMPQAPANPDPEPLTYDGLRGILETFVADLDQARDSFEVAGEAGNFVISIDPLRVRFDINGDGTVGEAETLAAMLGEALDLPVGRTKPGKSGPPDTSIGFDTADAFWLAGYSQVAAAPVDLLLAHDFSDLFAAVFHRLFPRAGLPMAEFSTGSGSIIMDAESDSFIADMVAALHTSVFPVIEPQRLADVRLRLKSITELSRLNWQEILAETDDQRELVPSPAQTSLVPDQAVTDEVVAAWHETLDTLDRILDGELLLPHWRFRQGFDLKAYFETATVTDPVLLLTGQGALPFLRDGPIADADSFAAGNAVFGDNWPNFALWFN